MTTTHDHLQIAQSLLNHNIRHMRDALTPIKNNKNHRACHQALKNALYGDRQIRGRLDIVATALAQSPDPDPL